MADLEVRRLGRTEMKPKALGLGCGYLGEPQRTSDEEATATIRAARGGPTDPAVVSRAHQMWRWCQERRVNIRDLAMQFVLNAPVEGNGIVLAGPANPKEFDEVYASATTKVADTVWQDFETAFDIGI